MYGVQVHVERGGIDEEVSEGAGLSSVGGGDFRIEGAKDGEPAGVWRGAGRDGGGDRDRADGSRLPEMDVERGDGGLVAGSGGGGHVDFAGSPVARGIARANGDHLGEARGAIGGRG